VKKVEVVLFFCPLSKPFFPVTFFLSAFSPSFPCLRGNSLGASVSALT